MEYSNQFRQPAFRGFGDQAMRHHRVQPQQAATPAPTPQTAPSSNWSQPELPTPSTRAARPAGPARLTPAAQARAQINTARAQARDARVATAQANAASAQHRLAAAQARTTAAQRRAQSAQRAAAPQAGPVQGPQTRMNWLRSQPATAHATPQPSGAPAQPRSVTINRAAHAAAGQNFGPPPGPTGGSRAASPSPASPAPPRPGQPPAAPSAGPAQTPAWAGRAARYGGLAVGLGAKAFESVNKVATDPKRSGNPLYKTSQGWSRS